MPLLEIVGWTGSVLVVVSLMQARVLRFRVLNLVGSVIATGYNAWAGIWPFMAMNAVIAAIDAYWLWRLQRERHDSSAYQVVEVGADDQYLTHVLGVHAADIAGFYPSFAGAAAGAAAGSAAGWAARSATGAATDAAAAGTDEGTGPVARRWAFLVLRGDETVGVVQVRDRGAGVGEVELDYVTPRFRDFTPGEFVHRRSGALAATGLHRLEIAPDAREAADYLRRVGFVQTEGRWVRELAPAA
ncbi:MAG TPA: hypothetical protein VGC67_07310 [Cellulomonas sp.]